MSFDSLTGNPKINRVTDSLSGGKQSANDRSSVQRISVIEDGIESTFNFQDVGNVPGLFNEVGDGGSYEAILLDESGEQVGTSFIEFELVKQLGNGSFIAEVTDILNFGDGNTITIQGKLNVEKFEDLQPARLGIVEGEGIFEGAAGKATLTQAEPDILDVVDIDLLII